MTPLTVVFSAAALVMLGVLLLSWLGQQADLAGFKRRLREAEETRRPLRNTTQEIWVHGTTGARIRRVGVPALLVGLGAAAFGAGYVATPRGSRAGARVDSLTSRIETADARREEEMKDLFNQMFRQRIATSIMLDEMNCVVERVARGTGEDRARDECREVVSERRDSLAQNP